MKIIKPFIKRIDSHNFHIPLYGRTVMKVSKGDSVKLGDVLFERDYKRAIVSYSITKELGVEPSNAKEFITRLNGEYVTTGEILAERLVKGGLVLKKIIATNDGLFSTDRLNEGYLDILSEHSTEEVTSRIFGKVLDIDRSDSIVISSRALSVCPVIRTEIKEAQAIFTVIKDGTSVYTNRDLEDEYTDRIVFTGRFTYPQLIDEVLKKGATAVVTWSMDWQDYAKLDDRVIVLGGFGQIPFDHIIEHAIKSLNGSFLMINSEGLIFADTGQYLTKDTQGEMVSHFKVNDIVRVIDTENYSSIAKIIDISIDGEFATIQINSSDKILISQDFLLPMY